jgi:hypothetical protein
LRHFSLFKDLFALVFLLDRQAAQAHAGDAPGSFLRQVSGMCRLSSSANVSA